MAKIKSKHGYGYIPDLMDNRDFRHKAPSRLVSNLPSYIDLRDEMPSMWDQRSIGACTAHATAAQVLHVDKTDPYEPSRLFIYYNSRLIGGTVGYDSGCYIRDSIKSVVKYGFCEEAYWPYRVSKFKSKPTPSAYRQASNERVLEYARVDQTRAELCGTLAQRLTINFGFGVYDSFMSEMVASTGRMTIPGIDEAVQGGHAVLCVGYDLTRGHYICRNSWGKGWGANGYFFMPMRFMENPRFCDDFWVVKKVQ